MPRDVYEGVMAVTAESGGLVPLAGVEVSVRVAGTPNLATIYQSRTGASQGPTVASGATNGPNPFVTGPSGAIEFFAELGEYDIEVADTIAPPRIPPRTFGFNAMPASEGTLPGSLLVDESIAPAKLADAAVNEDKLADAAVTLAKLEPNARPAALLGQWRTLWDAHLRNKALDAANAEDWPQAAEFFHLDPADVAVPGLTTKLRVRGAVIANAGNPGGGSYVVALRPVSAGINDGSTGVGYSLGAAVASATVPAPASGARQQAVSAEIDAPAAGWYTLTFRNTSAMNGSAGAVNLSGLVQVRHI